MLNECATSERVLLNKHQPLETLTTLTSDHVEG